MTLAAIAFALLRSDTWKATQAMVVRDCGVDLFITDHHEWHEGEGSGFRVQGSGEEVRGERAPSRVRSAAEPRISCGADILVCLVP